MKLILLSGLALTTLKEFKPSVYGDAAIQAEGDNKLVILYDENRPLPNGFTLSDSAVVGSAFGMNAVADQRIITQLELDTLVQAGTLTMGSANSGSGSSPSQFLWDKLIAGSRASTADQGGVVSTSTAALAVKRVYERVASLKTVVAEKLATIQQLTTVVAEKTATITDLQAQLASLTATEANDRTLIASLQQQLLTTGNELSATAQNLLDAYSAINALDLATA